MHWWFDCRIRERCFANLPDEKAMPSWLDDEQQSRVTQLRAALVEQRVAELQEALVEYSSRLSKLRHDYGWENWPDCSNVTHLPPGFEAPNSNVFREGLYLAELTAAGGSRQLSLNKLAAQYGTSTKTIQRLRSVVL